MKSVQEQSIDEWLRDYAGDESPVESETKIKHRARAKQIIDFKGLEFMRKIMPTDIDCLNGYEITAMMEFGKEEKFVMVELKRRGKSLDFGQRAALERCVDTLKKGGANSLLIVAEHTVDDVNQDIILADCNVIEVRIPPGKTRPPRKRINVKQCVKDFLRFNNETRNIQTPKTA